jgi:signal transduction histidine kinase
MTRAISLPVLAGAIVMAAGAAAALSGLDGGTLSLDGGAAALCGLAAAIALALSPAALDDPAQEGWYAGVANALARPWLPAWAIRLLVVASAPIAGFGVAAYALAALGLALTAAPGAPVRIDPLRATATGFLGLAVVLAARACGLLLGGAELPWAVLLVGSGLALFWSAAGALRAGEVSQALLDARAARTDLGLLLALAGVVWVLDRAGLFHQAGSTIAATCAALAVLALVIGPRWLRTSRALGAERTDRARAQERSALADHLHDSVLQTLALIQRRAQDPDAVSAIARRQERELREWLLNESASGPGGQSLAGALRTLVAEIEDEHGARVELVIVGDAPLEERANALLGAAREALLNAANHAPGAAVSLFAKVTPEQIEIFVHDRGPGFDPRATAPERRGVRESIVGRVERHGGVAQVHSAPGEGCEVTLRMGRQ